MKVVIAAVGQRQPRWADDAVGDYLARLPRDFPCEVREARAEPRTGGRTAEQMREAEGTRLLALAPAGAVLVAMDERGEDWTSERLARELARWRDEAQAPVFLVGGPDGLAESLQRRCRMRLRLSSMTLPHALARVLLAEQIYRAWSILADHPYHRA
jgi:23S rRNA (pseudouridine1915-N3)-methyltransferase